MMRALDFLAAGVIVALASAAQAEPRDLHLGYSHAPTIGRVSVLAPAPDPAQDTEVAAADEPEKEIDWSTIDLDSVALKLAPGKRTAPGFTPDNHQGNRAVWSRTENRNGSSNMTVKRALSTGLTTKVGMDLVVASPSSSPLPGAEVQTSTGSLWATTIIPTFGPLGWDKATIDARLNPGDDQGRLAANFSKSIPFNDAFSMTLQNGYHVSHTFAGSSASAAAEQLAKFNLLPTGTSLFAGTRLTSTDDRWLNSIGAEQKLFGGISITGTVRETTTGDADRSLTAAFKRAW